MKKGLISTGLAVIEEGVEEMMAEGAWCGHAYATAYLRGIQDKTKDLLVEISSTRWGKARECDLKGVIRQINSDYDGYITELYSAGLPHRDQIAEIINDAFKEALGSAIGWVHEFVKDSAMEEMASLKFDPDSLKSDKEGEGYTAVAVYDGKQYSISLTPYDKEIAGGDWRKAAAIKVLDKLDPRYERYIFC